MKNIIFPDIDNILEKLLKSKTVYLKQPNINELFYRQQWLRDSKTMAYNAGYDLEVKGYNKQDGTIFKSKDEMDRVV